MSAQVFPVVKLLFACDEANLDLADEKWVLKNPWSVVVLPPDAAFPFRVEGIQVYAQLADGLGEFEVSVQLRHVQDDDTLRTTGWSMTEPVVFQRRHQSLIVDTVFEFLHAPFREAGRYELGVVANGKLLQGQTSRFVAIDGSAEL